MRFRLAAVRHFVGKLLLHGGGMRLMCSCPVADRRGLSHGVPDATTGGA
jgi:hypothetical protein